MSFEPYDEKTLTLRSDPNKISIAQAVRFLQHGIEPLCIEETDALQDRFCLDRSGYGGMRNGENWKQMLRVLRAGSLVVTGILEAGVYSTEDTESYPVRNYHNLTWGRFVAEKTPDYLLGNRDIDVRYERERFDAVPKDLFVADFLSHNMDELGCSIQEEEGDFFYYRWATVDHLCVDLQQLKAFRDSPENPFADRANKPGEVTLKETDKPLDPRLRATFQKLVIALLAKNGVVGSDTAE